MQADLHVHSYYSDGECSPADVLNTLANQNITVFSIVDHNGIAEEVKRLKNEAAQKNILQLEGIEISCLDKKRDLSIHILGYASSFDTQINNDLQPIIHGYTDRARTLIEKINRDLPEINLDFELIERENHERYISRNTLARKVADFLSTDLSLKEILKQHVFVEEDDSWMFSPQQAISSIQKNGGLAVLAHSGRIYSKLGLDGYTQLIKELVEAGMQGLEIYYPSHDASQIDALLTVAHDYNLLVTGGSDWHGHTYTPQTRLGSNLPERNIQQILNACREI